MIILAVFISELLHDAVHFLSLTWHAEPWQQFLQGVNKWQTGKVERVYVGVEHFFVQIYVFAKVVTDAGLVQGTRSLDKVHYVFYLFSNK